MISNIIFDWDGTLARTLDLWLDGYQIEFETRGFKFTAQQIVSEFFTNHDTVENKYPDMQFPTIANNVRTHVRNNVANVTLYENAAQVVTDYAESDVSIALVSSSPRATLMAGLESHGLHNRFQSIIAGDDGYGHKPSTAPFSETLNRLDAAPNETIIIGDSFVDVQAGRAMGCGTCLFTPESNALFYDFNVLRRENPDYDIQNLQGLTQILPA